MSGWSMVIVYPQHLAHPFFILSAGFTFFSLPHVLHHTFPLDIEGWQLAKASCNDSTFDVSTTPDIVYGCSCFLVFSTFQIFTSLLN